MRDWWFGTLAMAVVGIREALRQRLWLLLLVAMAVLMALAPGLKAVDQADRLKLAVVAQSAVVGFVCVLLAILVSAAAVRRDLESRIGFMLFSKPLSRAAYVVGRWGGMVTALLIGVTALAIVGASTISLQFAGAPEVRSVVGPSAWKQMSAFGQIAPVSAEKVKLSLRDMAGSGVIWSFTDLPQRDLEVLIKARVRGYDAEDPVEDLLMQAAVIDDRGVARSLVVDASSPYGRRRGIGEVQPGQLVVRDRDEGRTDLAADYVRLRLPSALVNPRETRIQLTRLEARAVVIVDRDHTCLVSIPDGNFLLNVWQDALMQVAGAGLLTAWTLMLAANAGLGVALLGGLTMFLGGAAVPLVREVLSYDDSSAPMRRLMELAIAVFPDFGRFGAAPQLAAGQMIPWSVVGSAWMYSGGYIALFLAAAWWSLRRREL